MNHQSEKRAGDDETRVSIPNAAPNGIRVSIRDETAGIETPIPVALAEDRTRRRPFVEPALVRHEALTRLTLVSDFGGGGGGQGTFFG
jgi:hypothetical protein